MSHSRQGVDRYYSVISSKRLGCALVAADSGGGAPLAAELKAISQSGAVMLLDAPPEIQGQCQISVNSRKLDEPLLLTARVQWVRPNADGQWQIGCALEPPIAEAVFANLLKSGLLERRSTPREPAHIPVEIQLEPAAPRIPAVVRNISEGGLCCLTTNCPPRSTRHVHIFTVIADAEVRIPLKVRWSMHAAGDFFIGCQFVRQSDFTVIRKLQLDRSGIDDDARLAGASAPNT